MELRKKTSELARSSRLPRDFMNILSETLKERWPLELEPYRLIVEGRVFPDEIFLRVGLLEQGQLRQFNFEASMDFDGKKEAAADQLHIMADALEGALASYFETRNENEYPLAWQDYEINTHTVFIQSSRVNSELESIADDFLAKHGLTPSGHSPDDMPDDVLQALRDKLEQPRHH